MLERQCELIPDRASGGNVNATNDDSVVLNAEGQSAKGSCLGMCTSGDFFDQKSISDSIHALDSSARRDSDVPSSMFPAARVSLLRRERDDHSKSSLLTKKNAHEKIKTPRDTWEVRVSGNS